MLRRAVLFGLLFAVSCAPGRGALFVQVVSLDYDAGTDVDEIRVSLRADGSSTDVAIPPFVALADTSFARPTRVAAALDLADGSYRGTIHVLHAGVEIADPRPFRVDVAGTTVFTALVSRLCQGVSCPGAGDARSVACLAGRCVPPECSEEHPELCPMPQCSSAASCPMSTVSCASAACSASGVCGIERHDEMCAASDRCDAMLGCVPRAVAPPPPELLTPLPGSYTRSVWAGSSHLVRFSWAPSAGAQSHAISFTLHCPDGPPNCHPPDGYGQIFDGVTLELGQSFDTTAADQVAPVGHRIYFQVSACSGPRGTGACSASPWSYVEIGRVRGDYDGDGYADVAVGAQGGIQIFHGSAAGIEATPRTTIPLPYERFEMVDADVDGDGFGDLVVGVPEADQLSIGVFYGGPSGLTVTAFPNVIPVETQAGADCCYPSWLGDANDDGAADIAYAARAYDVSSTPDVGAMFFVPGSAMRMLGVAEIDASYSGGRMPRDAVMIGYGQLGSVPRAMPAVPFPLRIGRPGMGGYMDARAITDGSPQRGFMTTGGWQGISPTDAMLPGGAFGTALVVGDFDGDGTHELVASAPSMPPAGALVVMQGASPSGWTRWMATGSDTSAHLGDALVACDLDGDGDDELVVGAPGDVAVSTSAGGYAALDFEGGAVAPLAYTGTFIPIHGECGAGVGCADVNGDGRASVLLGCPGLGTAGVVWVTGVDGTLERELTPAGGAQRFGVRVAR